MTVSPNSHDILRRSPLRLLRKQFQALSRDLRQRAYAVAEMLPAPLRRAIDPPASYADMLLVDHGMFRLFYLNRHQISPDTFRAAQPAPHNIRRFAAEGIRTIVNLRGERDCGAYRLEKMACAAAGIELIDFKLGSRAAPEKETVKAAAELFGNVAYPMLMHCKSGADRVGLMSALYMHLKQGRPIEEAQQQLGLRYGHFRNADTGILDAFFDSYAAFNRLTPMPFLDWVDRHYDPIALKRSFVASGWSTLLVGAVLGRE